LVHFNVTTITFTKHLFRILTNLVKFANLFSNFNTAGYELWYRRATFASAVEQSIMSAVPFVLRVCYSHLHDHQHQSQHSAAVDAKNVAAPQIIRSIHLSSTT